MAEVSEAVEGFLCPLCKEDLKGFKQLEAHFREEHGESTQSKIKTNIKSLFDKARTFGRRRQQEAMVVDEGAAAVSLRDGAERMPTVTNVSGIDTEYWEKQEFGYFRSYTMEFKQIRDTKIAGTVAETNRLVIRLEKLFRSLNENAPKNSKQVKAVERRVVPWRPDDDTKRCSKCGRSFGVRRRKHHCRLCGEIMCKQCSQFISFSEAYGLLTNCPDSKSLLPPPSLRRRKLRVSRKQEAEAEADEDAEDLRMCSACEKLINRRLIHLQSQEKSLLIALYERMQLIMAESERIQPEYSEMAESLLSGDYCYTLLATKQKRDELIRLYETVDAISKDILTMCAAEGNEGSQRVVKLHKGIRMYASTYLQQNLLTLPPLPTMERLRQIREEKEREAKERIRELECERERQRQLEAVKIAKQERDKRREREEDEVLDEDPSFLEEGVNKFGESMNKFGDSVSGGLGKIFKRPGKLPRIGFKKGQTGTETVDIPPLQRVNSGSGWIGESLAVNSVDSQEDPFVLQQDQLKSYIFQARKAGRMDEVHALEASLREIEVLMAQQHMSYGFSPDVR